MREFKFRVWDKENNQFFQPVYEAYKGKVEELSIGLYGDLQMRTFKHASIHESLFPNRFVLQQYTGLNDKNNVEIFEGDIIETILKEDNCGSSIDEVIFTNGCFVSHDREGLLDNIVLSDNEIKELRVLGNIYENPELLLS